MARKDIRVEEDVLIENGDFVIGESDQQHVQHILQANKGNYRHDVTIGAGIIKTESGNYTQKDEAEIKKALEADGYDVSVKAVDGDLIINSI